MIGHDIGRKPDTAAWVGVDVGGTKILAGVVAADGTVVEVVHAETPARSDAPQVVEDTIVRAVQRLARAERRGRRGRRGGGVRRARRRGPVRPATSRGATSRSSSGSPTGSGCPSGSTTTPTPPRSRSSPSAPPAACDEALCITLGTGIGGRGRDGRRGPAGRSRGWRGSSATCRSCPTVEPCPCGQRGCWEQYSSGTALRRAALAHGAPDGTAGPQVTAAARAGAAWALAAFDDVGTWLGVGVAGLCSALDPEVVVVGGGLSAAGELLLEPARRALVAKLPGREHRTLPRLVGAGLRPRGRAWSVRRSSRGGRSPGEPAACPGRLSLVTPSARGRIAA